jgi:hypothetical protein
MKDNSLEKLLSEMAMVKTATAKNMTAFVESATNSNMLKESLMKDEQDEDLKEADMSDEKFVNEMDDDEKTIYEVYITEEEMEALNMEGDDEDTMVSALMGGDDSVPQTDDVPMGDDSEDPLAQYTTLGADGQKVVDLGGLTLDELTKMIPLLPEDALLVPVSFDGEEPESEEEEEEFEDDTPDMSGDDEPVVDEGDKMYQEKMEVYERKLVRIQRALRQAVTEKKKLQEDYDRAKAVVLESKNLITDMRLINENLSNMSRLMVDHNMTVAQREEVIRDFNSNAKSINESKTVFKMWDKTLRNTANRTPLKEELLGVEVKGKENVSVNKLESKTVVNEGRIPNRFMELAGKKTK